jgi:5-(carboxyamino)imidazole ribonucleotide mutase
MPKGVPVATVAIGNAWNAGVLAAQIIGAGSAVRGKSIILDRIYKYKQELRDQVLAKKLPES